MTTQITVKKKHVAPDKLVRVTVLDGAGNTHSTEVVGGESEREYTLFEGRSLTVVEEDAKAESEAPAADAAAPAADA